MPRERSSSFRSQVIARREPPVPTGLVASAKKVKLGRKQIGKGDRDLQAENWHDAAWDYYDEIGEFRYAVTWVGNTLSRAELYVAKDGKLTTDEAAVAAFSPLFGSAAGRREMLRQLGIHFTVAGEGYIVGWSDDDDEDDWAIASSKELSRDASSDKNLRLGDKVLKDPFSVRLWRPHPRKHTHTDSPTRAILSILSEISQLTKHVNAQVDSRLAGAGLLLLPSEISFGSTVRTKTKVDDEGNEVVEDQGPDSSAQSFVDELTDTMGEAIGDRESASALVPVIVQAPGETLAKIKHVTFWSELSATAKELRLEAIRRLALGMDMPPEVLTGTGDMNHWNQWGMEEASIKSHTEPLLAVITDSLTDGWLIPALVGAGMEREEALRYSILADTTKIRLRPNRSKEALELWDRGILKTETLLLETGFEKTDLMDDKGRKEWFLAQVAKGSPTPELVAQALFDLGVISAIPAIEPDLKAKAEDVPSLKEHPEQKAPEAPPLELVAAGMVAVHRALERIGNRVKGRGDDSRFQGIAPAAIHLVASIEGRRIPEYMKDSFSCVDELDEVFSRYPDIKRHLESYTRLCLTSKQAPSQADLRVYLATNYYAKAA